MAYNNEDREMVKGNWECAGCKKPITELPFKPSGDRPLYCKDCYRKQRDNDRPNRDFTPREPVKGNWECAGCKAAITELPFAPTGDRPIYCRDCWRKQRN